VSDSLPWLTLGLLGAYHGVNPAMGWLFAVLRGLQERRRSAVLQALLPIALGHEASIAVVVVLVVGAQLVTGPDLLRALGAVALVLFGAFRLFKPMAHVRWVGMRVGPGELALWSFLMSSAHGAGLMLFPVVLGLSAAAPATDLPVVGLDSSTLLENAAAVSVHTGAMLLAMAAVAVVVYDKLGVGILRRAWLNVDLLWAVAILAAGLITLFT
jgi:hypothetical protein